MNKPLVGVFLVLALGPLSGCNELGLRTAEPPRGLEARPEASPAPAPRPPVARTIELTPPSRADDEPLPVETVIQRGSGTFVAPPGPPVRASLISDSAGAITLNVVDAELREVVRLVLKDALGVNYVIDPSVGGRITVQTMRPLPGADLLTVLDTVLRMNGAALLRDGDLYRILPIEQAVGAGPTASVGPVPDAGSPGFGIRVVPLRYVSAVDMAPLLEPFTPSGGAIQVDPGRNLLLFAGMSDQLRTLDDLVTMFDVDWLQGMSFGLLG
jgi:general secretion pathway protein D